MEQWNRIRLRVLRDGVSIRAEGYAGGYTAVKDVVRDLHLQNPVPPEGSLIKLEWFQYYDELPRRMTIYESWDTASKSGELNDYSACTTSGIFKGNFYLLDVLRKRMDYPELKATAIKRACERRARRILIEDSAMGPTLESKLCMIFGVPPVELCTPKGDKIMRMSAQSARIEEGRVFLPREAPWLKDFLEEVVAFPYGKYDDRVDSMSRFLNRRDEYNQNRVRVFQQ